jgi:protein phosphatase
MLPKPVESVLIERHSGKEFQAAVAEVNGWRNNMEDAHLVYMSDDWAFFGVFDGHGGEACSKFVAGRMHDRLSSQGCPRDNAAMKQMVLGVDKEFLDSKQDSGSTGTMCVVHRPTSVGGKFRLRLANVGDSRVLLGRHDGTIVDGGGTDQGLTTDHKPDHPSERERIYRCGGHVATGQMGGPARVNGELSVSRCFGDASHKETGGPGPEDHPVTADPELGSNECNESDFLLLVCDGVSEGDFPNAAVVKLAADQLRLTNDPGDAARAICLKAIEAGSKDNVTCMVVLLHGSGTEKNKKSVEFIPGELSSVTSKPFMTAYEGMAKRAGFTLAQAAEMRYEIVEKVKSNEIDAIGTPAGPPGSSQRSAWFRDWEKRLPDSMVEDDDARMMRQLMARQMLGGAGGSVGLPDTSGRHVVVADLIRLRRAVGENQAIEWDERMSQLAGAEGRVKIDDPSDGTSQVWCPASGMTAWLPTCTLSDYDDASPTDGYREPPRSLTNGGQRSHLPPTPPVLDSAPQSRTTDTAERRQALLRSEATTGGPRGLSPLSRSLGVRGSSPSTGGPRGSSPSAALAAAGARSTTPTTPSSTGSSISQSGARLIGSRLLPATPASAGATLGGTRAPSPTAAAAGKRSQSPMAAAGIRSSTGGRYRVPSPLDYTSGNRLQGEAPAGRLSRSMPPRPPPV